MKNPFLPTDPEVIEEYLNILNRIEKERQRTPKGEPIAFPVPKGVLYAKGIPLPEQETSILRIFEQDGIIEITEKTIPIIDEFDPYENSETIRAVKIPDLDKFKNYRDKLSNLKNQLGKSYKERKADAEARAKKLRKQFEELNERQKELKELEERIYSRVRKDFEVPIQYYEEITKKISEQLAPIKDALEQAGKLQSAHIKNYLTPALQRLAPYLRQAEEEMKKINEIYSSSKTPYLSKAIVSSNLIEIEQRNQIISEISDLRKLVKELQTKEDVEREQKPLLIKIVGGMEDVEKNLEAIATKNEDVTVTKGKKRIRLPHFPPTAWKDVSIRFLDERNVFIQGNKKTSIADCESLGFLDEKSSKPNLGWEWLLELVRNNGESKEYPSPIPDTIKQRKRQISDFLQRLFKNDTNSFETIETGLRKVKYRAKITLIPPQADANNEESDHLGIKEYLKETMTSQYEPPKNENDY